MAKPVNTLKKASDLTGTARRVAEDRLESLARAVFLLHNRVGGPDEIRAIVKDGMASISADELEQPGRVSDLTVSRVTDAVAKVLEIGAPANRHGAARPEAAQAGIGGTGQGRGPSGLDEFEARGDREGKAKSRHYERMRETDAEREKAAKSFSGLGLRSDTVALFADTGMTRGAYAGLIGQGYSTGQIVSAAGYAGDLGVNAGAYAGKFVKLDGDDRGKLTSFVDGLRDDPTLSDDEKRRRADAFAKANPRMGRILGGASGIIGIVNGGNKKDAERDIGAAREREHRASLRPNAPKQAAMTRTANSEAKRAATRTAAAIDGQMAGMFAEPPAKVADTKPVPAEPKLSKPQQVAINARAAATPSA